VAVRDGCGIIGLTFCPGKKHSGLYSGAWDRDLCADLRAMQTFGATALVTLMESHELDDVEVPAKRLQEQAREFGLEWHHLPIRDVNVPEDQFEDLWTYSGFRLRKILARGGKVVIQCRGGLGRTGTIAGKLLVEFGDAPEDAIRKIRESRPGSIETREQEQYIQRCEFLGFSSEPLSREERALACLLGGAIGDAFGYAVEFMPLPQIRQKFGPTGIRTPVLHDGKLIVSDDTQMTLFTLEGLLRAAHSDSDSSNASIISSIRKAYLEWLQTQNRARPGKGAGNPDWLAQQKVLWVQRAPGNTCLSALQAGGHGSIDKPINDSKGCGGVMRIAPVSLVGEADEPSTVFQLAAESAALTHGHPSGYLSAGMLAGVLRMLLDGSSLREASLGSAGILQQYRNSEETLAVVLRAIALAISPSADHDAEIASLGEGWVGEEALAIGLYAALSAESFVDTIAIAANHSGDSDSTASIAGQIRGAEFGLDGIPHDWATSLDVLMPLLHLSRQLIFSVLRRESSEPETIRKPFRGRRWPKRYVSLAERWLRDEMSPVLVEAESEEGKSTADSSASEAASETEPTPAIDAARQLFKGAGLAFPMIPRELAGQLKQLDRWLFSTRSIQTSPYDLRAYVAEAENAGVQDYAVLAHSGHGVNSYAIQYYLVYRSVQIFLHLAWGGVYGDPNAAATRIRDCFSIADRIAEAAHELSPPRAGEMLTIVGSDFYGSYWSAQPSSQRNRSENRRPNRGETPMDILTTALRWLTSGP
jgi:ADP-ribosylglycohydrolase/protein-tyrosine phosphatase